MNNDIKKDGDVMSGNDLIGRRSKRRSAIGIIGAAGLCASFAFLVPVGSTTQAAETDNSQGMVCEWGDGDSAVHLARGFNLEATSGYTTEPDGNAIFDWSYTNPAVRSFQLPGPTLCAYTGETVTVTLTNKLLVTTSIQFPGQSGVSFVKGGDSGLVGPVASSTGALRSLVQDVAPNESITYSFTATNEGTYLYQSGSDPQLQVQMGLFGALVVYPAFPNAGTTPPITGDDIRAIPVDGGTDNAGAGLTEPVAADIAANDAACAYRSASNPDKCDLHAIYEKDRENILILSEVDPGLHSFMEQAHIAAKASPTPANLAKLTWNAYPVGYEAHYFMINGRSMPDTVAPNFAPWLPAQPYGALASVEPWVASINPLDAFIRYVGVGITGYDFHPHSNHEHVIAQDGALMKYNTGNDNTEEKFNILVGAGSTVDATFRWTNEEGYEDADNARVPVQWPQSPNLLEGDFWSASPYLGTTGKLNPGIIGKTQCGEYYHVAHNHDLTQVTNYGITFGGMLTLIKVEPLGGLGDNNNTCNG